jgi:hypothetical protein
MKVKYVIFDKFYPVLLGECSQHAEARLGALTPTSAGFCSFTWSPEKCGWEVTTYGESISLKLKPDPLDAHLIGKLLGN